MKQYASDHAIGTSLANKFKYLWKKKKKIYINPLKIPGIGEHFKMSSN